MRYLLLHGLGADRSQPLELVGPMLPSGARVSAPDLRAHGDFPGLGSPADFRLGSVAAEVAEGIAGDMATDPTRMTVVGISLGAAVALRLAAESGLPIDRLVLIRPAFGDRPLPPHLAIFPVLGELLHRYPVAEAEQRLRRTGAFRAIAAESRRGAAGVIGQLHAPRARERAMRLVEYPRNRALEADARGAPLPPSIVVSIIAARRDPVHPVSVAEYWRERLPGSALTVVPARDDDFTAYLDATRRAIGAGLGQRR